MKPPARIRPTSKKRRGERSTVAPPIKPTDALAKTLKRLRSRTESADQAHAIFFWKMAELYDVFLDAFRVIEQDKKFTKQLLKGKVSKSRKARRAAIIDALWSKTFSDVDASSFLRDGFKAENVIAAARRYKAPRGVEDIAFHIYPVLPYEDVFSRMC